MTVVFILIDTLYQHKGESFTLLAFPCEAVSLPWFHRALHRDQEWAFLQPASNFVWQVFLSFYFSNFYSIFALDQRLLGFYALLFNWMHELAYEFPSIFDRDATLEWVNNTLTSELKHYYALDDSSKTGTGLIQVRILPGVVLLDIWQHWGSYYMCHFKTLSDGCLPWGTRWRRCLSIRGSECVA